MVKANLKETITKLMKDEDLQFEENNTRRKGRYRKIPIQLQNPKFKFIKIAPRSKIPIEKDWQNSNNYQYKDAELLDHIKEGGNYGVATGFGNLLGIDGDAKEIINLIETRLPPTFTIQSRQGFHYYFICPNAVSGVLEDEKKENVGHIQFKGKQLIGVGSTHETGFVYKVAKDLPIATIDFGDVIKCLGTSIIQEKKKETETTVKEETDSVIVEIKKKINLKNVMKYYGMDLIKNPTKCLFHTSKGEQSFSYDNETYHCFHCLKSGNMFHLVMEMEKCKFAKAKIILMDLAGVELKVAAGDKQDKIKGFLVEGRQKCESLGCGFHNGVYYIGTRLFRENKPYTTIITYNKKAYIKLETFDEIRNVFGLNYKDDFYDEGVDNVFSKEAIQKWFYEDTDNITLKSVYEKLMQIFKKYIYLDDERKYSLLACYRIASFFMPVWRARARLFIYAEMGAAKSRLTQIMHNTGFNSIALGDWTLAYLQRLIESTRGETHIDDYETLDEDKKIATTRLIKIGFMKGFKAGKISEGKNRKPETYDLFNTTTLNNTQGLDFISTDRCITLRIPKIANEKYDKEPNFSEPIWKELRDELYILGLKYPEAVAETYETITSDKIRGRLFFIIKPELTIAKLISNNLYKDLEDFWIEEIEQRQNIDFETDWEFNALKQIYKLLSPLSPDTLLSLNTPLSPNIEFKLFEDVVKPMGLEIYSEEEFQRIKRGMSIVVGNSFSRNPIFKKRVLNGKKLYKVRIEDFKALLEAKGYLNPIREILGLKGATGDRGDIGGEGMGIDTPKISEEEIQDNPKKCYSCGDVATTEDYAGRPLCEVCNKLRK